VKLSFWHLVILAVIVWFAVKAYKRRNAG